MVIGRLPIHLRSFYLFISVLVSRKGDRPKRHEVKHEREVLARCILESLKLRLQDVDILPLPPRFPRLILPFRGRERVVRLYESLHSRTVTAFVPKCRIFPLYSSLGQRVVSLCIGTDYCRFPLNLPSLAPNLHLSKTLPRIPGDETPFPRNTVNSGTQPQSSRSSNTPLYSQSPPVDTIYSPLPTRLSRMLTLGLD